MSPFESQTADPSAPTPTLLLQEARERVKRSFDGSRLLERDEYVFPRFDMGELTLGDELGRGGFGTVLEIIGMVPPAERGGDESREEGNAPFAEKSTIFDIDDIEDGEVHHKRKMPIFRLPRRRGHHHDCHENDDSGLSIRLTNSHDALFAGGPSESIGEALAIRPSKSHDCLDGDEWGTKLPVNVRDGSKKNGRGKPSRTKSSPWSMAKARAHVSANSVSHLFHRNHRNNSHEGKGSEREGWHEKKHPAMSALPKGETARNFSFQAWRDSEAGDEGKDAISAEELEKYGVESCFFHCCHGSLRGSSHDKTSHSSVEDADGDVGKIEPTYLPSKPTASGLRDELVLTAKSSRRIVMYSAPKETIPVESRENEEDVGHSNNAYYQGYHKTSHNATASSGEARYAIKIISRNIVENDFKKFLQAAMDMAMETYFLSALSHPHIIKMRGVGQGDMFSPGYFLALDRLYDTLSDRIEGTWRQRQVHLDNDILILHRSRKSHALWKERIGVMKDLAGALAYLHRMGVIYRDLKPENAGFDGTGVVKLFDFGLAKEVHEEDACANGTYKITPNTGSICYMAPECGNNWPYNFKVDTYSFGIMLWEVLALESPFASYTPTEIRDMVMTFGERPKITRADWSKNVVDLMKSAWDSHFGERPTMEAVEEALRRELDNDFSI